MAPIDELRDGQSPVLGGRHLKGTRNNQPNDGFGGEGGVGEAIRTGRTRGGGRSPIVSVANGVTKKKIREGGGAPDFDGFCLLVGHNNQPKSGHIVGMYLGEAGHRAITIGEDAVESIRPSDFEAKK